jgi:hypothetical protein
MRYGGREEKRTVVMLVSLEPIQAPSHKERYIPLAVLVSWDTSFAGAEQENKEQQEMKSHQ